MQLVSSRLRASGDIGASSDVGAVERRQVRGFGDEESPAGLRLLPAPGLADARPQAGFASLPRAKLPLDGILEWFARDGRAVRGFRCEAPGDACFALSTRAPRYGLSALVGAAEFSSRSHSVSSGRAYSLTTRRSRA